MKRFVRHFLLMATVVLSCATERAADAQQLPKEDVIEVPAIGEGLCVSNIFQTNMVLQRDKPIFVWGWAAPGEQVTVAFAGEQASAVADKQRGWKIALPAMPADSRPQQMTIK
ncbi:MAG: hypothetical protein KDA42_20090, partial [Planctomycetales bacterium]|nr:hypothetical protein [Planctomycetales bacterium]